jgi:N-hydroxyarylamine O-acetyltransferase
LVLFLASMTSTGFQLPRYLERVGLSSPPKPDEDGLRQIHSAQAFSIPFENLDIHLGRPISLKPEALAGKILSRNRGGYCFELNGIFHLALTALGFSVRPHLARVLYGRADAGARTHEVLTVAISGNKWLADAGFGGPGLRSPLPLVIGQVQEQYGERYRLRQDSVLGTVLQKESQNSFLDLYAFNEKELTLEVDIDMANHYTSTSPSSIFRLHRMCSLPNSRGRVTLSDMELTIYRDGQSVSRPLPAGPAYVAAIEEHFGIDVDAKYENFLPVTRFSGDEDEPAPSRID